MGSLGPKRAGIPIICAPNDILKRLKPTLTPHYFRHNYVTLLYESGVDPLVAMKMVGHGITKPRPTSTPTLRRIHLKRLLPTW